MTTALDLITDALAQCRLIDPGQGCTADEAQHALRMLNRMLSLWRLERTMVYAIERQLFPLTVSQASYTIGAGGNFNITHPVRIEQAGWVDTSQDPDFEMPMRVLGDDEYNAMSLKDGQPAIPGWLYYDRASPLGHVLVPPPTRGGTSVALYLWTVLGSIAALSTVLSFPEGYEAALVCNLPLFVAPGYGVDLSQQALALAGMTKATIELHNLQPALQGFERGLGGDSGRGVSPEDIQYGNV